jgi:hypothetical protein
MIISDLTKPIERIALPEPLRSSAGPFVPSEGWNSVLYVGESRRVWRIDFEPGSTTAVCATGIVVPQSNDFEPIDFVADRAVFNCDDDLYVFVVSSGRLLARVPIKDIFGACLTPDGRYLMWFGSEATQIWPLNDEPSTPISTRLFHSNASDLPAFGYEPHSAARMMRPGNSGAFHVVVGHYGFAVDYSVAYKNSTPPEFLLDGTPRILQGFVFDPLFLIPGGRYPLAAINDGYGCGIRLIDVETGKSRSCPDFAKPTATGYGRYCSAIPSSDQDELLVKTTEGWTLWNLATDATLSLCSLAIEPVHFRRGGFWAVKADDSAVLRHYAVKS